MARKFKIGSHTYPDILVINIACQKADYWMAFKINEVLPFNLRRTRDLEVIHPSGNIKLNYALFYYYNSDSRNSCYLIANHHPEGKLFPLQKTSDYIFLINGKVPETDRQRALNRIKKIPMVLTAYFQDPGSIKTLQDVISDLEVHLIGQISKIA